MRKKLEPTVHPPKRKLLQKFSLPEIFIQKISIYLKMLTDTVITVHIVKPLYFTFLQN